MSKLKILMIAAEVSPIVKVGGLADVVGSLPAALKKLNCDVRIILPLYGAIDREKYKMRRLLDNIEIPSNGRFTKVNIWQSELKYGKIKIYFIENKKYFGHKDVYGGDNNKKFLFFSQAVLYCLPVIKFQPDVIHAHDYHTSMIPALLKVTDYEYFKDVKTVLTIHNLRFQGKEDVKSLSIADLEPCYLKSLEEDAKDKRINYLQQGIIHSDFVNTVSPTYAQEILTKQYGEGLEKLLKKHKGKLKGILNGIDVDFFNPSKDRIIAKKFSVKSLKNKNFNKLQLQEAVGLPQDEKKPLVGLVSRLTKQKGVDLITEDFMKLDCQFVFLGTGQKDQEDVLKKLAKKHPEKVSTKIMFDIKLAQQIYASSDMFLIPSVFEPCGLGQMIAMRYGTIPVVRSTGGLVDTVSKFSFNVSQKQVGKQRGFSFEKINSNKLFHTIKLAIEVYQKYPKKWQKIVNNCMNADFSWNKSAKEYLKIYKNIRK